MKKIPLLESINPLLAQVGDTIEIDHKTEGKIRVIIGNIDGKKIYWSTPAGLMGMTNSDNVIRAVEDQDLVDKYFPHNSKLSQFKVPIKVFRESASGKALLIGFTDFNGRDQNIWIPKSTLSQAAGWETLAGERYENFNLAFFIFWDDKNKDFFEKFAKFIHANEIMKQKDQFSKVWAYNRGVEKKVKDKLNTFFKNNGLGQLVNNDELEVIDYGTKQYQFTHGGSSFELNLYFGEDFRIMLGDEFLRDRNGEGQNVENLIVALKIADYIGVSNKDTANLLIKSYENLAKSYDPHYQMSDDHNKYNAGAQIAQQMSSIERASEQFGFYPAINKLNPKK